MKVKELIALLQDVDPEMPVFVHDTDYDTWDHLASMAVGRVCEVLDYTDETEYWMEYEPVDSDSYPALFLSRETTFTSTVTQVFVPPPTPVDVP